MGREINLLKRLPAAPERKPRHADPEDVMIARLYGKEYFDGDRRHGYGGYRYDGRWKPVAVDIIEHFGLAPGDNVLDVGCAKGFLVRDLMIHGMDAFGIDVSRYATVDCCESDLVGRLHLGTAVKLPFPDKSFDAVVSINTLHNLDPIECLDALREIERVCPSGRSFVQVDAYRTDEERERFLAWVLTAKTHGHPEFWLDLFAEAGYTGDYAWCIN